VNCHGCTVGGNVLHVHFWRMYECSCIQGVVAPVVYTTAAGTRLDIGHKMLHCCTGITS
jgi:hypothetical protein